ncbi:MAG: hypothetical protein QG654_28 [Patescibacteria group bacterium]|nr:hypothetical protein [Patescibacteria group bacterium]
MGFESKNLSDILENRSIINPLHEKMEKRKSFYQPNPEDFIGQNGYTKESVESEIDRVEGYKKRWESDNTDELKKQKKISDILEGVIVDQFSGSWLSEKAEGHYTSEVDDVLRGVDVVAELKENEDSHYLGFAIDVTMAKDPSVLDQKLAKNWKDIETGKFPEIKYFEDGDGNRQSLSPVRVLIAVNPNFARELIRLEYLNKKELLAGHKFQSHLIFQIKEQLEAYYTYAKETDNDNLMDKLRESLRILYIIISGEKEEHLAGMQNEVENEEDFKRIREYCNLKISGVAGRGSYGEAA